MSNPKHVSPQGLGLIQRFEGLRQKPYRDVVGVLTVGYGHTGKDIDESKIYSKYECDLLLQRDLEWAEHVVASHVRVPITQPMFDALVSLTFNIGPNNFLGSTLLAKLNEGAYQEAADQFPAWRKAGGQVVAGLVSRRADERLFFLRDGFPKQP